MATYCYIMVFPSVVVTLQRPFSQPLKHLLLHRLCLSFRWACQSHMARHFGVKCGIEPQLMVESEQPYLCGTVTWTIAPFIAFLHTFFAAVPCAFPQGNYLDFHLNIPNNTAIHAKPTRFHGVNSPSLPTENTSRQGATIIPSVRRQAAIQRPPITFLTIIANL